MSATRRPVVVGLAGGAGVSTLAVALHATDGGLLGPGTAGEGDVLLCRSDEPSLRQAAALACAPGGPRPVLVLVPPAGTPAGWDRGVAAPTAPLRQFSTVVALPRVGRWAGGDARGEAGAVLAFPPEELPLDVRPYAAALHRLVAALTGSGLLGRSTPALVFRPTAGSLWRGLRPITSAVPAEPARVRPGARTRPDLDDEALEAEPAPVTVGRTG